MQESLDRAAYIRKEIKKTDKSKDCKKYESLHFYYIETIKEAIRQGDIFLDQTENIDLGMQVIDTMEIYTNLLAVLNQQTWNK